MIWCLVEAALWTILLTAKLDDLEGEEEYLGGERGRLIAEMALAGDAS